MRIIQSVKAKQILKYALSLEKLYLFPAVLDLNSLINFERIFKISKF